MQAHASLGNAVQVQEAVVGGNGALIRLDADSAKIVDRVYSGRLALDGDRLIDPQGPVLPQRRRLARAGLVSIAVALDPQGNLAGRVEAEAFGCLDSDIDGEVLPHLRTEVAAHLKSLSPNKRRDRGQMEKIIVKTAKAVLKNFTGKNPLVLVHMLRV